MRLAQALRVSFRMATTGENQPKPAPKQEPPGVRTPTVQDHAILGVDRNTNVAEIKRQYATRTRMYSSRTPMTIEKQSQMKALQQSYDVLTSYYHLAEIRELPQGDFTKYELIGMILQAESNKRRWSEPWWIRHLFYGLIALNGVIGAWVVHNQ